MVTKVTILIAGLLLIGWYGIEGRYAYFRVGDGAMLQRVDHLTGNVCTRTLTGAYWHCT